MNKIFFLALICLSFVGCFNSNGRSGNGRIVSEQREVGSFTNLSNAGSIDVIIIPGNKISVLAEDDEAFIKDLITEVKNETLYISYKPGSSFFNSKGKVTIEVPTLHKITSSGSGDIDLRSQLENAESIQISNTGSGDFSGIVHSPSINLTNSGSGDVKLEGETRVFVCKVSGSGDVEAKNLKSESVEVRSSGSANLTVYASTSLKATVSGSSDIVYYGNPASPTISVSGSGSVKKGN